MAEEPVNSFSRPERKVGWDPVLPPPSEHELVLNLLGLCDFLEQNVGNA